MLVKDGKVTRWKCLECGHLFASLGKGRPARCPKRTCRALGNSTRPRKTRLKHRSAIEDVLSDFEEIIEEAAHTMTDEEFREAGKRATMLR